MSPAISESEEDPLLSASLLDSSPPCISLNCCNGNIGQKMQRHPQSSTSAYINVPPSPCHTDVYALPVYRKTRGYHVAALCLVIACLTFITGFAFSLPRYG